jgi:hypothetical protein
MFSKTAIALTAASLAIVTAEFMPFAQATEQGGYFSVNYPACVEDPSGAECQKTQAGSYQQRRGVQAGSYQQNRGDNATMHEHRGTY